MCLMGKINIDELTRSDTEVVYPNIEIMHVNQTLPVVLGYLIAGDTPLLVHNNDKVYIVGNILNSPVNIQYLLETSSGVYYNVNKDNHTPINDVLEYLDLLIGLNDIE